MQIFNLKKFIRVNDLLKQKELTKILNLIKQIKKHINDYFSQEQKPTSLPW